MFILNSPNFQLVRVHAQHKTGLDRKQREKSYEYDVKVKYILGKRIFGAV